MPRLKPTVGDLKERKQRALDWKLFRKDHFFTQRRLASYLGISRRTIQQVEAAKITPHPGTLSLFSIFREKHERNGNTKF